MDRNWVIEEHPGPFNLKDLKMQALQGQNP
jgi:hypothetical protein